MFFLSCEAPCISLAEHDEAFPTVRANVLTGSQIRPRLHFKALHAGYAAEPGGQDALAAGAEAHAYVLFGSGVGSGVHKGPPVFRRRAAVALSTSCQQHRVRFHGWSFFVLGHNARQSPSQNHANILGALCRIFPFFLHDRSDAQTRSIPAARSSPCSGTTPTAQCAFSRHVYSRLGAHTSNIPPACSSVCHGTMPIAPVVLRGLFCCKDPQCPSGLRITW